LLAFFGLAYGISWGCIALILSATGFDLSTLRPLDTGLIFVAMLLGPSASGLILTAHLEGRAGLRRLWLSLARWQIEGRWVALALLLMPALLLAVLLPLAVFYDPAFAPGFQWQLFAIGLAAGSFEELGWTGFATPPCCCVSGCSRLVYLLAWYGRSGMCWSTSVRTSAP
jgi:hypothetical protein